MEDRQYCDIHNDPSFKPMYKSKTGNHLFCPNQMDDGTYCKFTKQLGFNTGGFGVPRPSGVPNPFPSRPARNYSSAAPQADRGLIITSLALMERSEPKPTREEILDPQILEHYLTAARLLHSIAARNPRVNSNPGLSLPKTLNYPQRGVQDEARFDADSDDE